MWRKSRIFAARKKILKIMGIPVNINKLLYGKVVEWERLDFKRGWNPEDVMHSACAFANDIHNWGGGYIIVGVEEENGMPVLPPQGVALEKLDDIQKELVKLCNMIQPVCNVISKPVEVDGKMVLLLWVPGGDARPYKAPVSLSKEDKKQGKRYYVRQGSVTKVANEREEQQLMQLANKIPFDDRLCHAAGVEDLSPLLVKDYLQRVGSRLSDAEAMPFEQLCWDMHIVGGTTEDVHPRNVGVLFFCDDPEEFIPCAHIEIVRFGEDVSSVFEEKILSGPVHVQLKQALDYLKSQVLIEKVTKVDGQAEALRAWNWPYEALEEVVANAVYHKSWDERTPIEINVYPDRIEVFNVEGPMPPVRAADLKKERVTSRQYRNRRVGDFLKELDLTEGRNTGFPKIYASMRKNGSPMPVFETDETNSYFKVTLPVHEVFMAHEPEEAQKSTRKVPEEYQKRLTLMLSPLQKTILAYLNDNPTAGRRELSEVIADLTESKAQYHLRKLQKEGALVRVGAARGGHWEVLVDVNC